MLLLLLLLLLSRSPCFQGGGRGAVAVAQEKDASHLDFVGECESVGVKLSGPMKLQINYKINYLKTHMSQGLQCRGPNVAIAL